MSNVDQGKFLDNDRFPPVWIANADSTEPCEVGSDYDFTRCTRDELREWAQSIIDALAVAS